MFTQYQNYRTELGWMFRRLPAALLFNGWMVDIMNGGRSQTMASHSCIVKPLPLWAHPVSTVLCHLCIITQPPSLPPFSGILSNRWVPPRGLSLLPLPPLPLRSRFITLMLFGSTGCCVGSCNNLVACILSLSSPLLSHPLFILFVFGGCWISNT